MEQITSNTSPFKTYTCDENGLGMLDQALGYLKKEDITNLDVLKAINRIEWFLGNEINEDDKP